ncbi:MAG: shikimate kinase [Chloroflexaceae bacterium]|nr:shikimate kinase [Chloroflexaceae bacterium]
MRNIILTGFAGTGKTTIGQEVARRLGFPFVDMDWLIEERQGRTIGEIFATDGEPFFRQLEADLCHEIGQWQGYVIATGGGTLVNPDNLARLAPDNLVLCLDCDAEVLWQRLASASDRPLIGSADRDEKKAQLLRLLSQRQSAYARIERHLDTTGWNMDAIVGEIVHIWNTGTGEQGYECH